jgi:hypothetical protein
MEALGQPSRAEKLVFLFGIAFVLLLSAAALLIPSPPDSEGGSPANNPAWLSQHGTTAMTQVYVRGLAAIAELVFVVGLVVFIRRARGTSAVLPYLALAGGIGHGIMLVLSNMFTAAAVGSAGSASPDIIRTLGTLSDKTLDVESFLLVALFAGASLALLHMQAVPRWIGWLGLLAAVVALVEPFELINSGLEFLGLPALLLEMIWFLAVSIALLARGSAQPAVLAAGASAA